MDLSDMMQTLPSYEYRFIIAKEDFNHSTKFDAYITNLI